MSKTYINLWYAGLRFTKGLHLQKEFVSTEGKAYYFPKKAFKTYASIIGDFIKFELEEDVLKLIPRDVAEKHRVVPVNRAGNTLIVAMNNPQNGKRIRNGYKIIVNTAFSILFNGSIKNI